METTLNINGTVIKLSATYKGTKRENMVNTMFTILSWK